MSSAVCGRRSKKQYRTAEPPVVAAAIVGPGVIHQKMLHSGSCGVGNRIGTYLIELAKKDMRKAKKRFTVDDHCRATEGIECRKDLAVIDETPAAYKPIDAVMTAQRT